MLKNDSMLLMLNAERKYPFSAWVPPRYDDRENREQQRGKMIAGGKIAPAPARCGGRRLGLSRDTVAVRLASVMAASVTAVPVSSWTMRPRANIRTRSQIPSSSSPSDDETSTPRPWSAIARRR